MLNNLESSQCPQCQDVQLTIGQCLTASQNIQESLSERYCNGIMGVPITFLDKWNPEQFEIIELGNSRDNFTPNKDYVNPQKHKKDGCIVSGGAINCVLAMAYKEKPVNTVYYTSDNSNFLVPPYARILICRKVSAYICKL